MLPTATFVSFSVDGAKKSAIVVRARGVDLLLVVDKLHREELDREAGMDTSNDGPAALGKRKSTTEVGVAALREQLERPFLLFLFFAAFCYAVSAAPGCRLAEEGQDLNGAKLTANEMKRFRDKPRGFR